MKSAVIVCALMLTFNLLLLDKGKELMVNYQNSNKRNFQIEVDQEK